MKNKDKGKYAIAIKIVDKDLNVFKYELSSFGCLNRYEVYDAISKHGLIDKYKEEYDELKSQGKCKDISLIMYVFNIIDKELNKWIK
jgi:hypothetical protein